MDARQSPPFNSEKAASKRRAAAMITTGIAMLLHNRIRMLATLAGVMFAVLLTDFALGTFLGLLQKNLFLTQHMAADLWIVPKGLTQFGGGETIAFQAALDARGTKDVQTATPMLIGSRAIDALNGRKEAIQLIGVPAPYDIGGPWNLVAGHKDVLASPSTIILESSMRVQYGNINLRDVRELAGRRVIVGGFSYGLLPFGAAFGFVDYDFAREVFSMPRERTSFVLVKAKENADLDSIRISLQSRLIDADVLTTKDLKHSLIRYLLTSTPIGVTFGSISIFGVLVGTVIVSLTMFQSVVDNLKEFGTLKALGANMKDLAILMYTQALVNASVGTLLGVSLVATIGALLKTPKLALQLPLALSLVTFLVMACVCIFAATMALLKLRRVEPAMVFR